MGIPNYFLSEMRLKKFRMQLSFSAKTEAIDMKLLKVPVSSLGYERWWVQISSTSSLTR